MRITTEKFIQICGSECGSELSIIALNNSVIGRGRLWDKKLAKCIRKKLKRINEENVALIKLNFERVECKRIPEFWHFVKGSLAANKFSHFFPPLTNEIQFIIKSIVWYVTRNVSRLETFESINHFWDSWIKRWCWITWEETERS